VAEEAVEVDEVAAVEVQAGAVEVAAAKEEAAEAAAVVELSVVASRKDLAEEDVVAADSLREEICPTCGNTICLKVVPVVVASSPEEEVPAVVPLEVADLASAGLWYPD